jgi:signal transduction histidine kinase/CheY-like chemotaxis protein
MQRVSEAKTDALFQRTATASLAGVLFALLMCLGLAPFADRELLLAWCGMRVTVAVLRMGMSFFFLRSSRRNRPVWLRCFMVAVFIDALVWSVIGLWLVPQDIPNVSVLVLAALVGVVSVGSAIFQHSWRASAMFATLILMPVALQQLLQNHRSGLFIGSALLAYMSLTVLEARTSERRIRELLTLRFTTDRIAEERAEALLLAQRQSSVKGQFLATMSHEMRTPLHGILGLTRALRNDDPDGQELALIERAGEHLLTLINDALDFSKLEAGQVRLQPQVFDLAALVDDVVSLSVPPAYQAGLSLTSRLHMPRPCLVHGDASRLRQVLHNIVGNAIKFTEAGAVTVVAKHNAARGRARIAVHDTGIGISAHELPLVFEAFHQADGSFTRRFAGTGLGLTIARDLARAMGGDLVATSQPGRGSCFTVTLDLPQAQVDLPLDIEPPEVVALAGRVLLAEDNPVNAVVAEAVLRKLGLEVELVENGAQALAAFRERRPDLVLLDCQMPVMDGMEAARQIRLHEKAEGWPPTPLVALTANALHGDRDHSLAAGMDEHLAKPFRAEELAAVLARFLEPPPLA